MHFFALYMESIQDLCVATKQDALGILCIINWKILMWNVWSLHQLQCSNNEAKDGSKQTKEMRRSLPDPWHSTITVRYIFQRKQIIRQKNSSVCVMIIKRNWKRSNNRSFLSVYVRVISMMEVVTGQQNMWNGWDH